MAGLGVLAVFVTESEAGPPVLILISAVFLLIAIQGTAVRRANKESVELERRASPREIVREAKQILATEGPYEAGAFIEGAALVDPKLAQSSVIQDVQASIRDSLSYLSAVKAAIRTVAGHVVGVFDNRGSDDGYDFVLMPKGNARVPMIACVVKYHSLESNHVAQLGANFDTANRMGIPFLIVISSRITPHIQDQFDRISQPDQPVILTSWRDASDNADLLAAIESLR